MAIAIPIPLLIIYGGLSCYRRVRKQSTGNVLIGNADGDRDQTEYETLPTTDTEE